MKQSYTADPGVSLPSISLGSGVPIGGIVIDNASGGWLYVVELKDYCPPYTLGWKRNLEYLGQAISVTYGLSPAGQLSTQQGDPYTVTLDSELPGNDPGIPDKFIEGFTPVLNVQLTANADVSGTVFILIAGIPNKRINILTISVFFPVNGSAISESPVSVYIDDGPTFSMSLGTTINSEKPSDSLVFPNGIAAAVGQLVNARCYSGWDNSDIVISATYQVI